MASRCRCAIAGLTALTMDRTAALGPRGALSDAQHTERADCRPVPRRSSYLAAGGGGQGRSALTAAPPVSVSRAERVRAAPQVMTRRPAQRPRRQPERTSPSWPGVQGAARVSFAGEEGTETGGQGHALRNRLCMLPSELLAGHDCISLLSVSRSMSLR